jgi:hypothetical protein
MTAEGMTDSHDLVSSKTDGQAPGIWRSLSGVSTEVAGSATSKRLVETVSPGRTEGDSTEGNRTGEGMAGKTSSNSRKAMSASSASSTGSSIGEDDSEGEGKRESASDERKMSLKDGPARPRR